MRKVMIFLLLLSSIGASAARAEDTRGADGGSPVPSWRVARSGLSAEQGRRLAGAFGVDATPDQDGALQFVASNYGDVPTLPAVQRDATGVAAASRDEDGQPTVASAPDLDALRGLAPVPDDEAARMTEAALRRAEISIPGPHSMDVLHSTLRLDLPDGGGFTRAIDTSTRYAFTLDGIPLEGPGARVRVTYALDRSVTELRWATRLLERGPMVKLVPPGQVRNECAARYPEGSKIGRPRLVYWAPPLSERVTTIYPWWECHGVGPNDEILVSGLIAAALQLAPMVKVTASANGDHVTASASVQGGKPPYMFWWASATTKIPVADQPSVSYEVFPRAQTDKEILYLTVTDANANKTVVDTTLTVTTDVLWGSIANPALSVGGEFNVYEWGCVQASSDGFSNTFNANSVTVLFRWNGLSSWESDFKQAGAPTNGHDDAYIDNVDLAWYTGHGGPGAFTFGNKTHDDGSIVPMDARYGNGDLEWLQLESCQVLANPDGNGTSAADRWGAAFDGLHMLNGFHTNASCEANTAGTFSSALFASQNHPAQKIRQAWTTMGNTLEPAGVVIVSMGPIRKSDLVWDFDDYFWGQGSAGPDIAASDSAGLWTLTTTI